MMKKHFLLLVLPIVGMLSCKKDRPTNVPKICTIQSVSKTENGSEAGKFYYTFDAKGRTTQIDFKVEKPESYVYNYETNKVTLTDLNDGRNHMEYALDAQARIITWRFEKLKYDNNGYLTEINKGTNWYSKLYYSNGNLTKFEDIITFWNGDQHIVTTLFEYNSELAQEITGIGNPLNEIYYFENALIPLMGKASVNRFSRKTVSGSGMADVVTNYSYQEDDQGNITKVIAKEYLGKLTVYNVNYQCD